MGGIIVIFVYLTRIISAAKVFGFSPRLVIVAGVIVLPVTLTHYIRPLANTGIIWVNQMLSLPVSVLVIYSIFYLLEALIIVFLMSRKLAGPLKTAT